VGTIFVEVNEQKIELNEGSTLRDALSLTGTPHVEGTIIGIIKGSSEKKEIATAEYRLETSKGEIRIELDPHAAEFGTWTASIGSLKGSKVHWVSPDTVAIGPVSTGITPKKGEFEFDRYDVHFGAGGYDAKNTHLHLSKLRHISDYGAGRSVIGKMITGKSVIQKLAVGDELLQIVPIVRWEEMFETAKTTDVSTVLEDGMKVFTRFVVKMAPEAPAGCEHFLGLVRFGTFRVDEATNTYLSDDRMKGEICPYEHWEARTEGTVAVRTEGIGLGRAFVMKGTRISSPVHSIVGHVTSGIELVKMAGKSDLLEIRTEPERVMILGMGFEEASRVLGERGIEIEKSGNAGNDAIIVEQEPDTTMGIIKSGTVKATGVSSSQILNIKFYYDLAPASVEYFRHSIRLKDRPLGALPVYLTYENTILLKATKGAEAYKEIQPENTPKTAVKAGEVGVTNQAAKRYGLIGVKLIDDARYGPTGEKFECTNIVGTLLEPDRLKNVKKDDVVYLREVR